MKFILISDKTKLFLAYKYWYIHYHQSINTNIKMNEHILCSVHSLD